MRVMKWDAFVFSYHHEGSKYLALERQKRALLFPGNSGNCIPFSINFCVLKKKQILNLGAKTAATNPELSVILFFII